MVRVARGMMAAAGMVAVMSLPMAASAQSDTEMAEFRRDCTADYTRLCSAYDPNTPQVRDCFTARKAELSPRCAATIAKYQKKR
jgi:hypothetical protein